VNLSRTADARHDQISIKEANAMQVIILYPGGQRLEALALTIGPDVMRVVPRESADTVELRLSHGRWTDESGVPIEFEAFVAAPGIDIRGLLTMPRTCAAAS
jgi:hypothetical protein